MGQKEETDETENSIVIQQLFIFYGLSACLQSGNKQVLSKQGNFLPLTLPVQTPSQIKACVAKVWSGFQTPYAQASLFRKGREVYNKQTWQPP